MKQEMNPKKQQVIFGDDSIVIQKYISGIKGGRTLDLADFKEEVIKAGHVVIVKDGNYRPMPVSGAAYAALPQGYAYAGVVYRSVAAEKPAVSIMTWGEVNAVAVPYPMDAIMNAFKTACPHIDFIKDEEA